MHTWTDSNKDRQTWSLKSSTIQSQPKGKIALWNWFQRELSRSSNFFNECIENFNYHYLRKPYLQVGWRTIVMRHDILILKWLFYLVGFVYLVWFTRKCESSSTRNFDLKWLLPWLWTCRIISIFRRMHILTYEFWCKWAEFFQKYNGWVSSF